jgi:hypothetical protein
MGHERQPEVRNRGDSNLLLAAIAPNAHDARMKSFASLRAAFAATAILLGAPLLPLHAGAAPAPLRLVFVNENTTYAPTEAWFLFSYTGSAANEFVGSVLGSGPKSGPISFSAGAGPSAGSYFSDVYRITDLAAGVEISATPSTRIYVSLGQALDTKADVTTPSNPFSSFGSPSPTDMTDPNWPIRWDFFETTLSNPRSANDYGDISAINQLAIPLRIELYDSATEFTQPHLLQSAQTAPYPATLAAQLQALATANVANNNLASLPGNWHFETPAGPATPTNPYPNTFLRQTGPASGGTNPEWIGPYPSMNDYARFVANGCAAPIETTLTDTTSVADTVQQTYTMVTTASCSVSNEVTGIKVSGTVANQTWNAGTKTWNAPTSDGKTYEMRIALDTNVGNPTTANYSLSNALYGSAWQGNSGVSFWITDGGSPVEKTQAEFLASVSSNSTMALQTVNQWMQNLFVGYNFGLVGNTSTASHLPAMHPLIGVSLNDMGSAGWAELKALIDTGEVQTSDVPFFQLKDGQNRPLYNQWAKIVFENSQTVYGMQYSDMFQPLLALYSYQTNFVDDVYQPTARNVLAWKVTILPDLVPEPGAIGSAAAAFAALFGAWRRTRSPRGSGRR